MEYSEVQQIAKKTIEYAKTIIKPGMNLLDLRDLCERKMLELGADSFWRSEEHTSELSHSSQSRMPSSA